MEKIKKNGENRTKEQIGQWDELDKGTYQTKGQIDTWDSEEKWQNQ